MPKLSSVATAFFLIFALAIFSEVYPLKALFWCAPAFDVRCSATSHKKPCLFYCNYCCAKCLCVPSGTYGHKEECACYNNWKTKEGGPKCP
ncbi:gibberellin-regulated protein 12-like [Quercus lobata]|uniref:gibberellin-regulated protein 12-like n=1 Tax=Quercus lobata TaxID=97700 RepID=UPI0012467C76|nr:gibberellin-regulated protein 12-like [Quercus lobata]